MSTEEERICFYLNGLNTDFQVLSMHLNSARKSFNEVSDYVERIEGVRQVEQAMIVDWIVNFQMMLLYWFY